MKEIFYGDEIKLIQKYLDNKMVDIPRNFQSNGIIDKRYLNYITDLSIENCELDDLSFLTKLPNLKTLYIGSKIDYDRVLYYSKYSLEYFNHILDYSAIEKLVNLENLKIENEVNLKSLNFSKLTNLRYLELVNNPNLTTIKGLNRLQHLEHVEMYGNHITSFENLPEYINNTIAASRNMIDLSAYFSYVKNIDRAKKLYDYSLRGLANIQFSEKNGQVNYYRLDIPTITELYKKLHTNFKRRGLFDKGVSNKEKIDYIYKYVVKNIKFSRDEINDRAKLYYSDIMKNYEGKIPKFYYEHFGYLHSSYNTYYFKRGNCEGMVNLMKFMASMLGIDSEDVHCHDRRDDSFNLDHAVFRCKYQGVYIYFDPSYAVNNKRHINYYKNMSFIRTTSYLDLSRFEEVLAMNSYVNKLNTLDIKEKDRFEDWFISQIDDEDTFIKVMASGNFEGREKVKKYVKK